MSSVYEKHCEDMRMWAVEQELERLQKAMDKDRLNLTAYRIQATAQQKTIQLMSERLDRILNAVGGTAEPSRKEKKL